jgi:DNA-binding NarL/FixJ family response regulator
MAVSPIGPADLRGLRILVVEDEFLVAMELETMLRDLGSEVIGPLGRLDEAVAIAREETLDLAVLDVNIGGQPVTPVADALAARSIPFVFCTGYDGASLPGRHVAAPVLMKPCQAHELKEAVLSSLRGRTGAARPACPPSGTDGKVSTSPTTGAGRARRAGRRPRD